LLLWGGVSLMDLELVVVVVVVEVMVEAGSDNDGRKKSKMFEDELLVRMLETAGVEELEYESASGGKIVAKRNEW